jgi:hypothetical protein
MESQKDMVSKDMVADDGKQKRVPWKRRRSMTCSSWCWRSLRPPRFHLGAEDAYSPVWNKCNVVGDTCLFVCLGCRLQIPHDLRRCDVCGNGIKTLKVLCKDSDL